MTAREATLRDTLADVTRETGMEVIVDAAEGQRVLELAEEAGERLRDSKKKDDRHKEERSRYATFETKNGRIVTIRLSNHNASVSTFDHHGEADSLSIVVSAKRNKTRTLGPTWCWATCCMVLTRGR